MKKEWHSVPVGEVIRFASVAAGGLVVDISVSWLLAVPVGFSLGIAAVVGFWCGAAVNYMLHEAWTFQGGARSISAQRAARYLGALIATLLTRLAAIGLLSAILGADGNELIILLGAAAASLSVNYTVSKVFVFRSVDPPRPSKEESHDE